MSTSPGAIRTGWIIKAPDDENQRWASAIGQLPTKAPQHRCPILVRRARRQVARPCPIRSQHRDSGHPLPFRCGRIPPHILAALHLPEYQTNLWHGHPKADRSVLKSSALLLLTFISSLTCLPLSATPLCTEVSHKSMRSSKQPNTLAPLLFQLLHHSASRETRARFCVRKSNHEAAGQSFPVTDAMIKGTAARAKNQGGKIGSHYRFIDNAA